jgi:Icc-related predicted phosphoesterase
MSGKNLGKLLYSVAVFGDTHVNQEEDYSSSPYPCNSLANPRARYIVADINRRRPVFSIHLGDVVNPIPHLSSYEKAVANAKAIFKDFDNPVYILPGNHDIGDKPVDWMPAGSVNSDYIKKYHGCFGDHYYSFDYGDCHFALLNTAMCNAKTEEERAQQAWLEDDLKKNHGRRIFLFMHYPPYITSPDERGHYDNIDEPGRSWLLGLLEKYNVEALLAGHVHNLFYNRYANTDCYVLPSTCFVRHDFSEFYHIDGGDQNGRNDTGKLGYFILKIYENGHLTQWIRSYGALLAPGETLPGLKNVLKPMHSFEDHPVSVGFDMRHAWANVLEIPASGAVDEFERKRARNDYPLMALWELGARKMRIPLQDLLDNKVLDRVRILAGMGHEFTVYTYNIPPENELNILIENSAVISVWELVINWNHIDDIVQELLKIKARADLCVYISKLRNFEDNAHDKQFNHFINHGFQVDETRQIAEFLKIEDHRKVIDGFAFRTCRPDSAWDAVIKAGEINRDFNTGVSLQARFASQNPAEDFKDDLANANRTAETVAASMFMNKIDIFLDSFIDIDRSYFARTGLYDRRFNPRLGSLVFQHLHAALAPYYGEIEEVSLLSDMQNISIAKLKHKQHDLMLLLPRTEHEITNLPQGTVAHATKLMFTNLKTGQKHEIAITGTSDGIAFDQPLKLEVPALLEL